MNVTAADFGLTKVNYLMAVPPRDAGNGTLYLAGRLIENNGTTASLRMYYVDDGLTIKLIGNNTTMTVQFLYSGNL